MKKIAQTLAAIIAFSSSAFAASEYLTVDVSKVYNRYVRMIESQKSFNVSAQKAQEEVNQMRQEGMKIGEKYNDLSKKLESPALSTDAKRKAEKERTELMDQIQKKQAEIVEFEQQTAETLGRRRQSVINLHNGEIQEMTKAIAKERGAKLVLNQTTAVLYADDAIDVTDEVINRLNSSKK